MIWNNLITNPNILPEVENHCSKELLIGVWSISKQRSFTTTGWFQIILKKGHFTIKANFDNQIIKAIDAELIVYCWAEIPEPIGLYDFDFEEIAKLEAIHKNGGLG